MKLPRGLSGERVVRALQKLGYHLIRQKGSHARLRHDGPPVHHMLKSGTLHAIVAEATRMRGVSAEDILNLL